MADLTATGTPLPTPGASVGVWGDLYNAALTAVNNEVEAATSRVANTVRSSTATHLELITEAEWNALPTPRPAGTVYVFTDPA